LGKGQKQFLLINGLKTTEAKIMKEKISYKESGVDIDAADATKREMADSINTGDNRVLNKLGAFASLVDGNFAGLKHPILVLKTEEPGSKQKLAFKYGHVSSICYDMINHLIDDIVVMGAKPLYVQDCIICGHLDPGTVKELVESMSKACQAQDCVLVGGETSEQPGVVDKGLYILSASIVGVVDKEKIIDGSDISEGDVVLGVASNGLHTNGYSLVRAIMDRQPSILDETMDGRSFIDTILEPHRCYSQELQGLFKTQMIKGLAHITGGGIEGNLNRILPKSVDAIIDLNSIRVPEIFKVIKHFGNVDNSDMLRTFNMGIGLNIVLPPVEVETVQKHFAKFNTDCYPIGIIKKGSGQVVMQNELS